MNLKSLLSEWPRSRLGVALMAGAVFAAILVPMGLIADRLWTIAVWFPLINSVALLSMLPNSAAARPWPTIMGHCITASAGILIAMAMGPSPAAGAVAAILGVLGMTLMRAIHPPAAATALLFGVHQPPSLKMMIPIVVGACIIAMAGVFLRRLPVSNNFDV